MKKLVLILAVAFGASMVACSSSEKANDAENNAEAPEVVEETVEAVEAVDTLAGDTIVAVVDSVAAVAE